MSAVPATRRAPWRVPNPPAWLLHRLQLGRCFYCGALLENVPAKRARSTRGFTLDHVHPESRGDPRLGNIVVACSPCNFRKADREPTQAEINRCSALYGIWARLLTLHCVGWYIDTAPRRRERVLREFTPELWNALPPRKENDR